MTPRPSHPTASPATVGLFEAAGGSAAQEVSRSAAEVRDLAAALRRSYRRGLSFQAAALSEPETAAELQPLADQGWRVLHDRRWPGSTRANVDHLVIYYGGVAVLDTKHWSAPVQVRGGRLWCGDDDRHDTVEEILRLAGAVEELVEEVTISGPGRAVGLSPIHVLPVLVFTGHESSREPDPRIGRVLLTTLRSLTTRLARRSRILGDAQVALLGEYLAREMPPAGHRIVATPPAGAASAVPRSRAGIGVPIRPRPARPGPATPATETEPLFDPSELATDLSEAANQPLRDWMGYLHPAQAKLVRRCFNGPARVRGPAGTGKTVVLLHRAAWLATIRPGRILVTSFVRTLPTQLSSPFRRLAPDTADKVDFIPIHRLARELLADNDQHLPVRPQRVERAFAAAWAKAGRATPLAGLAPARYWREEIDHVIKGRGLRELADYEAVDRRGRGQPLSDNHKHSVWTLLHAYQEQLDRAGTHDHNDVLSAALDLITHQPPDAGWSAVLVDEVQDLTLLGLRLCRELAGDGTDALFLVGDGQQALYPGGVTLAEAGISVTGRAVVLRTNYRNTRQILDTASRLVADRAFNDLDATLEPGHRPVEVLRNGPPVHLQDAPSWRTLSLKLREAIRRDTADGIRRGEMAVLCHSHQHLAYLTARLTALDIPHTSLEDWTGEDDERVKLGTIHRSKGLDFAAVYVVDLSSRPAHTGSASPSTGWEQRRADREYVACTRPRDRLWIGRFRAPDGSTAARS